MLQVQNKIGNEYVTFEVKGDILYATFSDDLYVNLDVAKNMVALRKEFVKGQTYPMLIEKDSVIYMSAPARKYLSTPEAEEFIKAIAIVIKRKLTRTLLNFFLLFHRPNIVYKVFPTIEEAEKWLKSN